MNNQIKSVFTLEKLDSVKIVLKNYKEKIKQMIDIMLEIPELKTSKVFSDGISKIRFDISFCKDDTIHQINKEYRQKDCPTDVITFSLFADDPDALIYRKTADLGQIIVSVDTAKKQAKTTLEEEILTLGNAIVESYTAEGTKLYATTYSEPGLQAAATPTYAVSEEVLSLINTNPNIREEARNGLWRRYNEQNQGEQRVGHINAALAPYEDNRAGTVETGIQEEITNLQSAWETFVEELDGTGEVGKTY